MLNSCTMLHDIARIEMGDIEKNEQDNGHVYFTRKIRFLQEDEVSKGQVAFTLFADSREALMSLVA